MTKSEYEESENEAFENYPVAYSIDHEILMHRDVHFSGNFSLMLDYYHKEGKGVNKEFEISRIEELQEMELKTGKNLSPLMLSGAEAEKVAQAIKAYRDLRNLYKKSKNKVGILIADLILAEEKGEEEKAIQAVVAEKTAVVSSLIDLINSEAFYDPLFPSYGQAPMLAAKCLGKIGDRRSIISLFETMEKGDFFHENIIFDALRAIGEPAKAFLIKILQSHPLTYDNENAALALLSFKEDPEVSLASLKILKEIDIAKHESLATYLALNCKSLPLEQQKELLAIAKNPKTPKTLSQDIYSISKSWKSNGS